MFLKNTKRESVMVSANAKTPPSIISKGMSILGNLIGEGNVEIDGHVDGNVKATQLTIHTNGVVNGDLIADSVHVYGEVKGVIRARAVMLYATCRVEGIIMHESLTIEDGAFVDGKFKRTDRTGAPANDDDLTPNFEEQFLPGEGSEIRAPKILEHFRLVSS